MFVEAWANGVLQTDSCTWAAQKSIGFLEQVASQWQDLKRPASELAEPPINPIVHDMWKSACLVGDPDLTPMASVAGAIAGATADLLARRGMTRVVVNNGGDLAIRLGSGDTLTIGIRPYVDRPEVTHQIVLTTQLNIRGVCTSGLGGRSFTRGIASAATVFAAKSSISDASATAIANATLIQSSCVKRIMADTMDPSTDLKGLEITHSVGDLTEEEIERALNQGVLRAEELVEKALIIGACITVKGRMRCTRRISQLVTPIE